MRIPESFHQLGTPLPPMLLDMVLVKSDARYMGFYYLGTSPFKVSKEDC
jgi:hypothetical protein